VQLGHKYAGAAHHWTWRCHPCSWAACAVAKIGSLAVVGVPSFYWFPRWIHRTSVREVTVLGAAYANATLLISLEDMREQPRPNASLERTRER